MDTAKNTSNKLWAPSKLQNGTWRKYVLIDKWNPPPEFKLENLVLELSKPPENSEVWSYTYAGTPPPP